MRKLLLCLIVVGASFAINTPKQAAAYPNACIDCGGCCACVRVGGTCSWTCC